jgi:hypothetical protein
MRWRNEMASAAMSRYEAEGWDEQVVWNLGLGVHRVKSEH